MEEMINLVLNNGISVVVVGLFLWDWVTNKKQNTETLNQLSISNQNTQTSLELLQKSSDAQIELITKVLDKMEKSTDAQIELITKVLERIEK